MDKGSQSRTDVFTIVLRLLSLLWFDPYARTESLTTAKCSKQESKELFKQFVKLLTSSFMFFLLLPKQAGPFRGVRTDLAPPHGGSVARCRACHGGQSGSGCCSKLGEDVKQHVLWW